MRLAGRVFTVNTRGEDLLIYNGTTGVLRVNGTKTDESRKLLVERVAASRYISKSARLHDLLLYLCERVLEGYAGEIHEQEVGHKVLAVLPTTTRAATTLSGSMLPCSVSAWSNTSRAKAGVRGPTAGHEFP
jgi:hypothetical protein